MGLRPARWRRPRNQPPQGWTFQAERWVTDGRHDAGWAGQLDLHLPDGRLADVFIADAYDLPATVQLLRTRIGQLPIVLRQPIRTIAITSISATALLGRRAAVAFAAPKHGVICMGGNDRRKQGVAKLDLRAFAHEAAHLVAYDGGCPIPLRHEWDALDETEGRFTSMTDYEDGEVSAEMWATLVSARVCDDAGEPSYRMTVTDRDTGEITDRSWRTVCPGRCQIVDRFLGGERPAQAAA